VSIQIKTNVEDCGFFCFDINPPSLVGDPGRFCRSGEKKVEKIIPFEVIGADSHVADILLCKGGSRGIFIVANW